MEEQILRKNLGNKIRQFRKRLNITQEILGEKLSRNQRQISLIENGTSFPTPATLVKMSKIFNCSLKDLFDFEPFESIENIQFELQKIINYLPEEKLKILYLIGKNL